MAGIVTILSSETGESHRQPLWEGSLDWLTVLQVFQADVLEIENFGSPPLYRTGERTGLTRHTFQPNDVIKVKVTRKWSTARGLAERVESVLREIKERNDVFLQEIRQEVAQGSQKATASLLASFMPSASDTTHSSSLAMAARAAYNPAGSEAAQKTWCMALGRFLPDSDVVEAYAYLRKWRLDAADTMGVDVDNESNIFLVHKAVKRQYDQLELIVVPESNENFRMHILDPKLESQTIDGSVNFSELNGKLLQFKTTIRPAKRALAFHAEMALHRARGRQWPAAKEVLVPEHAWSSEGCPHDLRKRYFADQLELVGLQQQA